MKKKSAQKFLLHKLAKTLTAQFGFISLLFDLECLACLVILNVR